MLAAVLSLLSPAGATIGTGDLDTGDRWCLVLQDQDSDAVLETLPVTADGRFAITYLHSYYGAPATEWFRVEPSGELAVERIESPNQAVLDYYELPGVAIRSTPDGWSTEQLQTPPMRHLDLLATTIGQRTLVVGERSLPLWLTTDRARPVTIRAAAREACPARDAQGTTEASQPSLPDVENAGALEARASPDQRVSASHTATKTRR